ANAVCKFSRRACFPVLWASVHRNPPGPTGHHLLSAVWYWILPPTTTSPTVPAAARRRRGRWRPPPLTGLALRPRLRPPSPPPRLCPQGRGGAGRRGGRDRPVASGPAFLTDERLQQGLLRHHRPQAQPPTRFTL